MTVLTNIFNILNDGHPLISYLIVILFIVVIVLFVKGLNESPDYVKTIALLASIGWFALAWGYLGRTFGLIMAFDKVAASGDFTPGILSEGLKMALVGPLCGLFTFLTARLFIIILTLKQKNKEAIAKQ